MMGTRRRQLVQNCELQQQHGVLLHAQIPKERCRARSREVSEQARCAEVPVLPLGSRVLVVVLPWLVQLALAWLELLAGRGHKHTGAQGFET